VTLSSDPRNPASDMRRPLPRRTLTALAAGAACLAAGACSTPAPAASSSASRVTSDLGAVQVTGPTGGTPAVSVPTPFSVSSSTRRVLTRGSGAVVAAGQRVTVDYLGINGTDGHQILSSYGGRPPRPTGSARRRTSSSASPAP